MQSGDEQTLLQQGIAAVRVGQKARARELLKQVIGLNRYNELAWLWLSGVIDDLAGRMQCLENVLAVNPDNAAARKGLAQLQAQIAPPEIEPLPSPTRGALYDQSPSPRTKSRMTNSVPEAVHPPTSISRAKTPATEDVQIKPAGHTGFGAFVAAVLAYLGTAIPVGIVLGFIGVLIAHQMDYPKVTHTRFLFKTRTTIEPLPPEIQFMTITLANWTSMALAGVVVARRRLGGSRVGVVLNCLIIGIAYVLLSIALQPKLSELSGLEIINTTVSYVEFIFGPPIGMLAAWLAFQTSKAE